MVALVINDVRKFFRIEVLLIPFHRLERREEKIRLMEISLISVKVAVCTLVALDRFESRSRLGENIVLVAKVEHATALFFAPAFYVEPNSHCFAEPACHNDKCAIGTFPVANCFDSREAFLLIIERSEHLYP